MRGARRFGVRVAAALVGVLALAGCLRVEAVIDAGDPDNVTFSTELMLSSALLSTLASFTGESVEDLLNEFQAEAGLIEDLPPGVTFSTERIDTADMVGFRYTASGLDTDSISEALDEGLDAFTVVRDGDTWTISFRIDTEVFDEEVDVAELEAFLPPELMSEPEAHLRVRFPGVPLEQTGGTIEGDYVVWDLLAFERPATVSATWGPASGFPWWIIGVVAGVVVLGAVVVVVLTRGRGRSGGGTGSAPPGMAAGLTPLSGGYAPTHPSPPSSGTTPPWATGSPGPSPGAPPTGSGPWPPGSPPGQSPGPPPGAPPTQRGPGT